MTNIQEDTEPTVGALAEEADGHSTRSIATARSAKPRGGFRRFLPTMTPWLVTGIVLILGVTAFGLLGPFLVGDPNAIRDSGMQPPSGDNLLGTTQTGQDVLAQLAYATRGSLQIGLIVGVLATVLSAFFGILGAYLGGIMDEAFSLFSNVFLVIPGLPLVIVISGLVPQEARGLWTIAIVLAITSWAGSAGCSARRRCRSEAATTCPPPGSPANDRGGSSRSRSCRTCCRCSRRSSCSP